MSVLPPGTLLQLMYLRDRLEQITPGKFVEIGPGSGEITALLLEMGWRGHSYDLDVVTIERLRSRFSAQIEAGLFSATAGNYLEQPAPAEKADLVISCMVMEHLNDTLEAQFVNKSAEMLVPGGLMIGLVPASPAHWGIEDDIAGHQRRYTRDGVRRLMMTHNWSLSHITGLTCPVSNLLLPVSNFLVRRNESAKLKLATIEKTKFSGRRNVRFKTHFPSVLGLLLNRYAMLPFYFLQKVFGNSEQALVLYFESVRPPKEAFATQNKGINTP